MGLQSLCGNSLDDRLNLRVRRISTHDDHHFSLSI
jgi:hypothetical protein